MQSVNRREMEDKPTPCLRCALRKNSQGTENNQHFWAPKGTKPPYNSHALMPVVTVPAAVAPPAAPGPAPNTQLLTHCCLCREQFVPMWDFIKLCQTILIYSCQLK